MREDGRIVFQHYSRAPRNHLSVHFRGSAAEGSERKRREAWPEIYTDPIYLAVPERYVMEENIANMHWLHHVAIPADKMYDLVEDPMGFREKAREATIARLGNAEVMHWESKMLQYVHAAGYWGTYHNLERGHAVATITVSVTPEKVVHKITGEEVPGYDGITRIVDNPDRPAGPATAAADTTFRNEGQPVNALMALLKERGVPFKSYKLYDGTSADYYRDNPEILKALQDMGYERVVVGNDTITVGSAGEIRDPGGAGASVREPSNPATEGIYAAERGSQPADQVSGRSGVAGAPNADALRGAGRPEGGRISFSRAENFAAWTEGQPIIDPESAPVLLQQYQRTSDTAKNARFHKALGPGIYLAYHGTTGDITAFGTRRSIANAVDSEGQHPVFVSPNPNWASGYRFMTDEFAAEEAEVFRAMLRQLAELRESGASQERINAQEQRIEDKSLELFFNNNVLPVWVKLKNPFMFWRQDHLDMLFNELPHLKTTYSGTMLAADQIKAGGWYDIGKAEVQDALKRLGFDGYFENEEDHDQRGLVQLNIAVFDNNAIKSVTGNTGAYGQRPITEQDVAHLTVTKADQEVLGTNVIPVGSPMTPEIANRLQALGDIRFSKTKANVEGWAKSLELYHSGAYDRGGERFGQPVPMGSTPDIYRDLGNWYGERMGLNDRLLVTTPREIQKVESGKDARGIPTREPIAGIDLELMPAYLADPVAVFLSDNENAPKGSLLALLDVLDADGLPVMAAIHKNISLPQYDVVVNRWATAYGKTSLGKWFAEQVSGKNRFGRNTLLAVNSSKGMFRSLLEDPQVRSTPLAAVAVSKARQLPQQPLLEQYISERGGGVKGAIRFSINPSLSTAQRSILGKLADRVDEGLPSLSDATAYLFAVPEFEAERDPTKKVFVENARDREVHRAELMGKLLGLQAGVSDLRGGAQKMVDFFTKWESGPIRTEWGLIGEQYKRLPESQRAALDVLLTEGDVEGVVYASQGEAMKNRAISKQRPTTQTFQLYKRLRKHIDTTVHDVRVAEMERLFTDAGMSRQDADKHIAEFRNRLQALGDIRFSVTPRSGNDLPLDIATVATHSPALIEKHAMAIGASYTGFRFRPSEKPLDTVNRLKRHMADNLVWLYNATPEQNREVSAKWYEGANRIAATMAQKHGYTTEQAAGVIAALSPQQPWFNNLYLADRVMRYMSQADNLQWRAGMADRLPSKFSHLSGRGLTDLHAADERSAWIRAYDEAVGPGQATAYLPDGTAVGTAGAGTWFVGNDMIAKSVNILDGKPVDGNLSLAHKVRNFYNNIVNPQDRTSVTIDTHAVAAAFLAPMGGASREVLHNFGGSADGGKPGSSAGAIGTYYIVADAYRDAAARLGILPRELQSVVWEQVRIMFPAAWKRSAAAQTIHQKWSDYAKGKRGATLEAVRGYIAETVGIQSSAGGNAQTGGTADQSQLYRDELGAGRDGGRPGSGVAGGDTGGAGVGLAERNSSAIRFSINPSLSTAQRSILGKLADRVDEGLPSLSDATAYLFAVPEFEAERDPTKKVFVENARDREVHRAELMGKLLGLQAGASDLRGGAQRIH